MTVQESPRFDLEPIDYYRGLRRYDLIPPFPQDKAEQDLVLLHWYGFGWGVRLTERFSWGVWSLGDIGALRDWDKKEQRTAAMVCGDQFCDTVFGAELDITRVRNLATKLMKDIIELAQRYSSLTVSEQSDGWDPQEITAMRMEQYVEGAESILGKVRVLVEEMEEDQRELFLAGLALGVLHKLTLEADEETWHFAEAVDTGKVNQDNVALLVGALRESWVGASLSSEGEE